MMTNPDDTLVAALRASLKETDRLRQQNDQLVAAATEPIAIVGMSCRLPGGVRTPEDLWRLVADGTDAISGFPIDRGWDLGSLASLSDDPDRTMSSTGLGGFVYDVAEFDPGMFGISPREAVAMDPQQRLLLELAWELFERSGMDPLARRGSRTGVFVGNNGADYLLLLDGPAGEMEGHLATGNATSVQSGRIAYTFGLTGPAFTVDTACSSSLVALHLAVQALRQDECEAALVGGVTVMSTPGPFTEFSRQNGVASDGRCKSFAAAADGTGWGEGAGMLLLEKLSDAQRLSHDVLAVVRGSAINQDGASNGLSAPNGPAQRRVLAAALRNSRLRPSDVDVVEAHGTGTKWGDPIEAEALLEVYGQDRPEGRPLWLGSVKSNIGHTQAAAGVVGVMKMVLAMHHGLLPRTLHVDEPSPHIDWSSGAVELLTEEQVWPETEAPRRAGVSAFGLSGTNAHVIIEQAPAVEPVVDLPVAAPLPVVPLPVVPLVVSTRVAAGLATQAGRLLAFAAERPELSLTDLGWSLSLRAALEHRAVALSLAGLSALAEGTPSADVVTGFAGPSGGVVLVFPGQDSQWVGMAAGLLDTSPVFTARLRECDAALGVHLDFSVEQALRDGVELARVDVVQPALFAVMVSLAAWWADCGVIPAAVVGHSQGEIAAACVAGYVSLADAARVVALRSQALARLADLVGPGAMMSVAASLDRVEALLAAAPGASPVSVAAVNGPSAVVVAGAGDAVLAFREQCEQAGLRVRVVDVDYASHSPQVEPAREQVLTDLAGVTFADGVVPWYSTVSTEPLNAAELNGDYWYQSLREPVRFAGTVRRLLDDGFRHFVEVSPHPVLTMSVQESVEAAEIGDAVVLGTLRRGEDDRTAQLRAMAGAFVQGIGVRWAAVFAGSRAQRVVDLPTYAFTRNRFWLNDSGLPEVVDPPAVAVDEAEAGFWASVEAGDLTGLAGQLRLDHESLATVLPALATWRQGRRDRSLAESWRYRVTWTPLPEAPASSRLSSRWLILVPGGLIDDEIGRTLADRGAQVESLTVEPSWSRADLAEQLRSWAEAERLDLPGVAEPPGSPSDAEPLAGVVSLLGLQDIPDAEHPLLSRAVSGTLVAAQALGDAGIDAPLWIFTRQGLSVAPGDQVDGLSAALVWGLGRVAGLEHPQRWGGLLDLPAVIDERAGDRLAAVLSGLSGFDTPADPGDPDLAGSARGDEDQVAIRAAGVFGRRLEHAPIPQSSPAGPGWRPRGTVMITGGTGALGAHLARWAADNGAAHLILTSRRGQDAPGAKELRAELTAAGVRVSLRATDVGDREQVAALVQEFTSGGESIQAVLHTAGVGANLSLEDTDSAQIAEQLAGKLAGAAYLDELLADADLDAFVTFSSLSGVWGSQGHAAYGCVNAGLDALAEQRRARGGRMTAIAWGTWAEGGMTAHGDVEEQLRRRGLLPMSPERAIEALRQAIEQDDPTICVVDVDWERFATLFTAARARPLIADLPEVRRVLSVEAADDAAPSERGELEQRLIALSPPEQERLLLGIVRSHAAGVLGYASGEAIDPRRPFRELGLDSLTAIDLRNRLRSETGVKLPATLVFDYPNATILAAFLRTATLGMRAGATAEVPAANGTGAGADEPIAIIAMSCRFPGGIRTPEDLWRVVADGTDTISPFPTDRGWNLDGLYDADSSAVGTSYVREGGFIYDAPDFDPGLFGITPREALAMDPQQRLLLESSWELLERGGMDPLALRGSRTGVFAGTTGQDYLWTLGFFPAELEGHLGTGNAASVLSGRISYTFGLEGPALTVDTGCSSSLVALHLAVQSLRQGECDLALAGGVTVMSTPGPFTEFSRKNGLAGDGRCKSFAAAADGTGWGEGVGMVMVERLSDAVRLGHPVLAVVRGSAVNQDGASNGLTAPNGLSQQRVIRQALANARLSTADVDVVEAHGTGTTLGDPIEAQAVLATYGQDRPTEKPLWLGSVKSNLGHTQGAAGIAGVMKMVLAMQHELLPRTLHVDEPSPHIDWSASAVSLLTTEQPWPAVATPRRAGVSAFGVSGTNAHVIIEQAPSAPDEAVGPAPQTPSVVPLLFSSRDAAGVPEQAARVAAFLARRPSLSLVDVGISLSQRAGLDHRAVTLSRDGLTALADGTPSADVVTGVAGPAGGVVFVFPGQGSQWLAMAAGLLDSSTAFTNRLRECDAALSVHLDFSVEQALRDGLELERVDVVQPALFAVMVSLAAWWADCGVVPAAVVGHSQGEIAAACVAGYLSVADAARVVALRSRALRGLTDAGLMMSIAAPAERVAALLDELESEARARVSVAAVNGPSSVVVSGDQDAVVALRERCDRAEVRARLVDVDYASHSPQVEPVRGELLSGLAELGVRPGTLPWYSTVSAEPFTESANGEYWYRNLREPVRFDATVARLLADGYRHFVEVSPHPVLTTSIEERAAAENLRETVVLGTLRRGADDRAGQLRAMAGAYVRGIDVRWAGVFAGSGAQRVVDLPTYAFQRRRFWLDSLEMADPGSLGAADGVGDALDAGFWAAVEAGDLAGLGVQLDLDDGVLDGVVPALATWRRVRRDRSVTDAWRYRVTWAPLPEPGPVRLSGRWLLLAPAGMEEVAEVGAMLSGQGAEVTSLSVDASWSRAELADELGRFAPDSIQNPLGDTLSGVVSVLALGEQPVAATLVAVQALGDARIEARLWAVTQDAVAAVPADRLGALTQAPVWGLGRVVALEHPQRWGGLLDLPATPDGRVAERLAALLAQPAGLADEDQVAVRAAGLFGRRLLNAPITSVASGGWRPTGTVLITGGTGARGSRLARWAVDQGADHVILLSRRGPDAPGADALRDELSALGALVTVRAGDVGDREQMAALVREHTGEGGTIRSVIHAAGLAQDTPVAETSPEELAQVLRARVDGALVLDEALADVSLDAFVCFSSVAGIWGSGRTPAYAASDAFLDAFSEWRRARGRVATTIAWGPWAGAGIAGDAVRDGSLTRRGVFPLAADHAILALETVLDRNEATIVVADIDWDRFVPAFTMTRPSRLLGDLEAVQETLRRATQATVADGDAAAGLRGRLSGRSAEEIDHELVDLVRAHIAGILGFTAGDEIAPDRAFREIGFDSVTAVELRNQLNRATGLRSAATLVFDHPSPRVLARHLRAEMFSGGTSGGASVFDELDRLERSLDGSETDQLTQTRVRIRLQSLLAKWSGSPAAAELSLDPIAEMDSDDELLQFIDTHLRRS